MKATRLFLLAVVLLATVLLLAACANFDFGALLGGTTTTVPTTTAPTTTAPDVTTAATTTAPTTPPTTAEPNPITEVKAMSDGNIQLFYEDGKKQFLGTAPVREGYNSVSVTHTFDAATGILTLTLVDNTARNAASDILSLPKTSMTVRLREAGGNLEWAPLLEDNWTVLCPYKFTGGDTALVRLCAATGFGKHEAALGEGVILVIEGDKFRVRSRGWKTGTDFVIDGSLQGGGNSIFNLDVLGEISANAPMGSVSRGNDVAYKAFKNAQDDVAPIQMNGTYIAAVHGYNIVSVVPNSFGLTLADIGTVYRRSSDGQQYMLIKLPGYNAATGGGGDAWFCPFDSDSMANGNFGKYTYVTSNKSSLKAGNTITREGSNSSLTIAANATEGQIRRAINHLVQYGYLNGTTEIDLTRNGAYEAEFIDIYEEYNVLYLPAVLKHLQKNVGRNNNESHYSEEITDYYFSHRNTFRFHKNGSCVIYSTYDFKKDINLSYIGGSQSVPFATHYVYVPGSRDYGVPTLHSTGQINIGKEDLVNSDVLTSSYFQFTDDKGTQGMNLGYNTQYGLAQNEIRDKYIGTTSGGETQLISYFTTYKMYPKVISNCTLKAGDSFSLVSYRIPSYIMDEDFTAINWYWVGDDIYLSLHTKEAVDKTVTCLPEYMNGMEIEVIEGSDNFSVNGNLIENGSISVASTGAGYAILKLSPAN